MQNIIYDINRLRETNGNLDLTEAEIKTIAGFVIENERQKTNSTYLEIGVFGGGTIRHLKSVTKTTEFTGIDLFEDFKIVEENTHVSGTYHWGDVLAFLGDRVKLIKGDSAVVVPTMAEQFDFIFIDGNHTFDATMLDFQNASKLLAPGGQIGFHNCSTHIGPDDAYVKKDGGPWLVTQKVQETPGWKMIEAIDRLKVFIRVPIV